MFSYLIDCLFVELGVNKKFDVVLHFGRMQAKVSPIDTHHGVRAIRD